MARKELKAITEKLEKGIQNLFESDNFKNYLKTLSKFHHYSLGNTILIAMQKPDATLVAGYTSWQKNFHRHVKKGEKGISILAPTPYKKKVEVEKVDPTTGDKAKEIQEIVVPAFKVVNVFDVSQTEGKELPTIGVSELTGDVAHFDKVLESLKRSCPVPIEFEEIRNGAKGYFQTTGNRIAIQKDMSQVQTVKTLIHEMAHQKLHSNAPELRRNAKEVEAEAVAYTVSQHFGIETSDYSFGYIAGWSKGKALAELKDSLDRISTAADELITAVEGHLKELMNMEKPSVLKALEGKGPQPNISEKKTKQVERDCL